MADDARVRAFKAVEAIFERFHLLAKARDYNGFDLELMRSVKILSATPKGEVVFELVSDERYGNLNGVMHGGAAGLIFDMCTTSALGPVARPGFWDFLGGVTRSLNISYLKAIPTGTKIRIHSSVQQVGRTMALLRGEMRSVDGSVLYCTCEHHKVAVPTPRENLEVRVEWDEWWDRDGKLKEKAKI